MKIIEADCIDAMREMDEASVDAIVTDPPYGLEFMGKEWDSLRSIAGRDALKPSDDHRFAKGMKLTGSGNPTDRIASPNYAPKKNPRCRRCSRLKFDHAPRKCQCERPDWDTRTAEYARTMQQWHQAWATEALRVLKPGGHLLAFGGTRTYHRLACAIEDAGFEVRDSVIWLYGSGFPKSLAVDKAIDRAAGAEREVVGTNPRYEGMSEQAKRAQGAIAHEYSAGWVGDPSQVTAPATPPAQQWQGWGTALKPSNEPVVCAQKPLDTAGWLVIIGSHLDRLETEWQAQGADPITQTGEAGDSSDQTAMSQSESMGGTFLSIVTSWRECWGELSQAASTSTIETATGLITVLKTLSSCLPAITVESIQGNPNPTSGSPSPVEAADNLFAAAVCNSRATLALSADGPATSSTRTSSPVADERPPDARPIVLARKPLIGTVSANVQQFGTGAINVDACRIGTDAGWSYPNGAGGNTFHGQDRRTDPEVSTAGRWPANVALSPEAAAELDRQSGTLTTNPGTMRNESVLGGYHGTSTRKPGTVLSEGDTGGASRFFATFQEDECETNMNANDASAQARFGDQEGGASVGLADTNSGEARFRYVAKASRAERNAGLDGGRSNHPTVKPIDLMRWLVRLVTPPGGTVLDPFAGSGTTGIAATLEGFDFIGIEREAEYAEIAKARIEHWQKVPQGTETKAALKAEAKERKRKAKASQEGLFE